MKGKILKKLKTIRPADYLKQDRVLQIKALNGYVESFTNSSSFNLKDLVVSRENEPRKAEVQESEVIDESQQLRDLEEGYGDDKENIGPQCLRSKEQDTSRSSKPAPLSEIDISSFRRPDMNSESLFDPLLLAAFEQAVKEHVELRKSAEKIEFFEDFKVVYIERDTSMHMKFKEELWNILDGKPLPPRLFVKGRYIGGAEEVLNLHEQGRFKPLLAEIPLRNSNTSCEGCDGVRFMICFSCNGSQRIIKVEDDEEKQSNQCSDCNENGLIICPYCCS
ncbi:uncharacterized protein At3g28850-like [Neltuma alba]|uniref:uncharacterized protein At3g28850-like n=1 Tax=Neltuma alba TaxID=207710 RepID=UPI0010A476A3|nr:uncharacterized protein At3g28850-like [Prosopis alba]